MKMEEYIKIRKASQQYTCPRKIQYLTVEAAKAAWKDMRQIDKTIEIYPCYACGHLHLGRPNGEISFKVVTQI